MLNYAGIPMPSAVPGASGPMPSRVIPTPNSLPAPSPLSAINVKPPAGGLPPQLANAISAPKPPLPGNNPVHTVKPSPHPADHNWEIVPQTDGTLLLRLKGGPIVKVISGIKVPGADEGSKK